MVGTRHRCMHSSNARQCYQNETNRHIAAFLLILDEVHEANSPSSIYGLLLPYIKKCSPSQRPRVLALTASPSGANSLICDKLFHRCAINLELCHLLHSWMMRKTPTQPTTSVVITFPFTKHLSRSNLKILSWKFLTVFQNFHKFFNGNWKISVNVSIKLKINDALKVLSHASLVAQTPMT